MAAMLVKASGSGANAVQVSVSGFQTWKLVVLPEVAKEYPPPE